MCVLFQVPVLVAVENLTRCGDRVWPRRPVADPRALHAVLNGHIVIHHRGVSLRDESFLRDPKRDVERSYDFEANGFSTTFSLSVAAITLRRKLVGCIRWVSQYDGRELDLGRIGSRAMGR